MAEFSIELPSHWEKTFSGWDKLNITREQVLLAKKAAATWESIAKTLEGMCNVCMTDHLVIGLDPEQVAAVDQWRHHYVEDLPSRAEAIVRLMQIGLKEEGCTIGKLIGTLVGGRIKREPKK